MELTELQNEKRENILAFLKQYDTLDYEQYVNEIRHNDERVSDDLCSDIKCISKAKKEIRLKLPKFSRLSVYEYSNDGDHDSFEICGVCGKYLNKYLTWYEDELDYILEHYEGIKDLKDPDFAFRIRGILESIAWLSERLNSQEAKSKLLEFIDKVCLDAGI